MVKALLPTVVAAVLLSQEFPHSRLDADGTLFTVAIYQISYLDALQRIKVWMNTWSIGPVLVTGSESEDLLLDFAPRILHYSAEVDR